MSHSHYGWVNELCCPRPTEVLTVLDEETSYHVLLTQPPLVNKVLVSSPYYTINGTLLSHDVYHMIQESLKSNKRVLTRNQLGSTHLTPNDTQLQPLEPMIIVFKWSLRCRNLQLKPLIQSFGIWKSLMEDSKIMLISTGLKHDTPSTLTQRFGRVLSPVKQNQNYGA